MQEQQPPSFLQNEVLWGADIIWELGGSGPGRALCALLAFLPTPVRTQLLSTGIIIRISHNSLPLPWKILFVLLQSPCFAHTQPDSPAMHPSAWVSLGQSSGLWKDQEALEAGRGRSTYVKGLLCAWGSD